MNIKELSFFMANRPGSMAKITQMLAEKKIDIRALSLAENGGYGVLRLIVRNPDEAESALKEAGVNVLKNDVIAVSVADRPGEFSRAVQALAEASVNIEYMYAFLSRNDGEAVVILRTDNLQAASAALTAQGVRLLGANEVYNL